MKHFNLIEAKVHCKNTDEWYEIESGMDIQVLQKEIVDSLEPDDDFMLIFDQWELPELLKEFAGNHIPADLPDAIGFLEDANYELEVYEAYEDNMGTSPSSASDIQELIENADEAYQGEYKDDEDFAYELADQLGSIDKNVAWPMSCIDWERAGSELMQDYFESNGHYFRNI